VADTERYTLVEWSDACLNEWRGRIIPLSTVLARLAEGCDDAPAVFFALVRTLARDPDGGEPWARGGVFACGREAVVGYVAPASSDGWYPSDDLRLRAERWFRRHHVLGPRVVCDLHDWDRRVEDLPSRTPVAVRQRLVDITNLYELIHQEVYATPAVATALRRVGEVQSSVRGVHSSEADRLAEAARDEMDRSYRAASRLIRRRVMALSVSRVARL
jgi:hypothetical protein